MTKKSLRVLVTAAGGNLGQAIVKALALAPDMEIIGCDMDEHGVGPLFVKDFETVPAASDFKGYLDALERMCRSLRPQAVVPGSTDEIAVLFFPWNTAAPSFRDSVGLSAFFVAQHFRRQVNLYAGIRWPSTSGPVCGRH